MKYIIHFESNKNPALTPNSEFYKKSIIVEADDISEARKIAIDESSIERIDNTFLPINITIAEFK